MSNIMIRVTVNADDFIRMKALLAADRAGLLLVKSEPLPFDPTPVPAPHDPDPVVRWSQQFQERVREVPFSGRVRNLLLRLSTVSHQRWDQYRGWYGVPAYVMNAAPFTYNGNLMPFDLWARLVTNGMLAPKLHAVVGFGSGSAAYQNLVEGCRGTLSD